MSFQFRLTTTNDRQPPEVVSRGIDSFRRSHIVEYYREDLGDWRVLCLLATANAYCCAWNTIEQVRQEPFSKVGFGEDFCEFLQQQFPYTDSRPSESLFKVGQFHFIAYSHFESCAFLKNVPYTKVGSYQSASEPGHLSVIYSINFHETP